MPGLSMMTLPGAALEKEQESGLGPAGFEGFITFPHADTKLADENQPWSSEENWNLK